MIGGGYGRPHTPISTMTFDNPVHTRCVGEPVLRKKYIRSGQATYAALSFNRGRTIPEVPKPGDSWYDASWERKWYGAQLVIRFWWVDRYLQNDSR